MKLISAFLGARCSAPLSSIDLLANKGDGPLIDRGSIPCLDSCKIGFAGLVSCARAPAMALEEICRRVQRAGRGIETSGAVGHVRMFLGKNCVWPISPCIEPRVPAERIPRSIRVRVALSCSVK